MAAQMMTDGRVKLCVASFDERDFILSPSHPQQEERSPERFHPPISSLEYVYDKVVYGIAIILPIEIKSL